MRQVSFIEDKLEVWDTLIGEVCPLEYCQVDGAPEAKTSVKPGTLHGQSRRTGIIILV